jgi:hypothetical protein
LLFWANPPDNAFDDHFEPVFLIMEEGEIPPKQACWECFQPPVFYLISATIGNVTRVYLESDLAQQLKLFQFLPCLYGIATVYIVYLILRRVTISNFSRTLAFGTVCFLPRHIYMSAMHTNDTLSYLLVSLCAYLMLVAIDYNFYSENVEQVANLPPRKQESHNLHSGWCMPSLKTSVLMITLMVAILLALFTKSTALVLVPMVAAILVIAVSRRIITFGKRSAAFFILLFLVPSAVVGSVVLSDMKNYGQPLPLNIELLNVSLTQPPGKDALSFFSFKPWTTIKSPILAPDNVESFWTLIYSRMWFDMEPMFLQYSDPDPDWWDAYDDYLNRHDRYGWPGSLSLSPFTHLTGSTLIALGIVPLVLILIGIARSLFGKWAVWSKTDPTEVLKVQLFLVLLLVNLAGVILHTFRYPYYSFMKAAFVLNSLSALALFLALGVMLVEKYKSVRWGISIVFGFSFLLTTIHVLHIVQTLGFGVS